MARKREWDETMMARFIAGTFDQIATVLREDEDRTDFVREAVRRELLRRAPYVGSEVRLSESRDALTTPKPRP